MAKLRNDGQPSELELQILGLLWEHGQSTVREILEQLTDGKQRGYTAVLSVVQSMQRKKLVTAKQVRGERAYRYAAKSSRESILGPLLGGLVSRVFGGDPALAVQQLLDASELDADTIARLRDVVSKAADRAETTDDAEEQS